MKKWEIKVLRPIMDPYNAVYIWDLNGTEITMRVGGAIPTFRECNRMIKALQNVKKLGAYRIKDINRDLPLGQMDERNRRKS